MQIKFLVDTQLLPPVLAKHLASSGFDSIHSTHFPQGHLLQDLEIRRIALDQNRIIITKDSDFFDGFILRGAPPKVLLLQVGNIKNSVLLNFFDRELSKITLAFETGANPVVANATQLVSY